MASARLSLRGRVFAFHGVVRSCREHWTRVLEARGAVVVPSWRAHHGAVIVLTDVWVDTLPVGQDVVCVTEYWLRESLKAGALLSLDAHPFFVPPPQAVTMTPISYPMDYDDAIQSDDWWLALLPCSPKNFYDEVVPLWPYIVAHLTRPTTTTRELIGVLQRTTGETRHSLNCLKIALDELMDPSTRSAFFSSVLPTIKRLVLDLPFQFRKSIQLLPSITSTATVTTPTPKSTLQEASVHLTRAQLLPLLSCMFLAVFPVQDHVPRVEFPWFNMERMFSAPKAMDDFVLLKAHKIRTILEYFLCIVPRFLAAPEDLANEIVTFTRVAIDVPPSTLTASPASLLETLAVAPSVGGCQLSSVRIQTNVLIEDLESHLQMDFANKFAGGGVMNGGSVQEEIRFMLSPELLVACLVFAKLEPNESFIIHGSERFSNNTGYGGSFRFAGRAQDSTPVAMVSVHGSSPQSRRQNVVVGIDAISYSGNNLRRQYSRRSIMRDLVKALVGFAYPEAEASSWPIATGNWGCGVFRGDPELKFLIQWLAASLAGRDLVYVIFEQMGDLQSKISALVGACEEAIRLQRVDPSLLPVKVLEFMFTLEPTPALAGQTAPSEDRSRRREHRGENPRSPPTSDKITVLERATEFVLTKKLQVVDLTITTATAAPSSPTETQTPTKTILCQRKRDDATNDNGSPQLKQPKLTAYFKNS